MCVMESNEKPLGEEYPGWKSWQSLVGGQWHARLAGAVPPQMVHGNTEEDLREQVRLLSGRPVT